ncbi:MAG: fimbrial biogenesis outer membrane usher protein [Caulobacter sp.]|nr:fimbrial biogenesis outer membrane usher protein [Caulobacter sp.]
MDRGGAKTGLIGGVATASLLAMIVVGPVAAAPRKIELLGGPGAAGVRKIPVQNPAQPPQQILIPGAPAAQPPKPAPLKTTRLNPSSKTITMVVTLKDRQATLGDVEVQVAPDDTIQVAVDQVFELLRKTVDPVALEPLRPLAEPGVFAPLERFAAANLPLTFDARTLELAVAVPASARPRQSIGLAELDRITYGEFAKPEPFSAYANFRGAVDYVHESSGETGLGDGLVLLDGAARFGGIVVEGEGSWQGGDDGGFTRDGTRAVYDDIRNLNRWVAGDLIQQSRGFQGIQEMGGISVSKTYALLDPQRNVAPRGGRTFTVNRESTVEAFINGNSVRTIRLQPGTYDVSDFPFVQGSNDVQLVITDDAGQRDVVSFSIFIDRTQLAAGLSEYALYAGVGSNRLGGSIDYSGKAAASGFYRYGLSENLTLGGNFQYFDKSGMIGGEAVWGSPLGTIGGDVAVSQLDSVGSGWAFNVSYERLIQDQGGGLSILATAEARSENFGAPGQLTPQNPYVINTSFSINKSFGDSSFAGIQLRYAKARDAFEDEQSVRLTYGRRLTDKMNVIFDADWAEGGTAGGATFRVSLVRRFGTSGSMRAEYDSRDSRVRLGYQTSGGRGVGAWSGAGNLDLGKDLYGLNGSLTYAANRADLGIAHSTAYSQVTNDISDQRTSLRAATGIAYAGGRVAVGRPISDGFVIVKPYAGGKDIAIEVEPSPDGYYAKSGVLGPALYGQVSAYSPRTVTFDAPGAPAGFDVGTGAIRVYPPYRAGYVATVGSDYGVTAVGRLLRQDGEPLTLLAGVAIEQGGEGRRVEIFTNRSGSFGAGGLKAGRWRIEMPSDPPLVYELVITDAPNGIARSGDLRPVP